MRLSQESTSSHLPASNAAASLARMAGTDSCCACSLLRQDFLCPRQAAFWHLCSGSCEMRELDATSLPHPPAEARESRPELSGYSRPSSAHPNQSQHAANSLGMGSSLLGAVRHVQARRTPRAAATELELRAANPALCARVRKVKFSMMRKRFDDAPLLDAASPLDAAPMFACSPLFAAAPPLDAAPPLEAAPPPDAAHLFASSPLFVAAPPLDAAPPSTLSDPVAGLAVLPFTISLSLLSFSAQDNGTTTVPHPDRSPQLSTFVFNFS